MGNNTIYIINIAIEAVMIAVLSFLFFAYRRQNKRYSTTSPLIFLTSVVTFALAVQIVTWLLFYYDVYSYNLTPLKIVYTLDYISGYVCGMAFYYYVEALAKEGYTLKGLEYNRNEKIVKYLKVWGIVTTIGYIWIVNLPFIYHIENGVIYYNIPAYIGMHIMLRVPYIYTLITIIKRKDAIEKNEAKVISCFIFVPMFSVILDETFRLCISYVMVSFFTLALYIKIDLERSMIIEKQERNLVEKQTEIMLSQMQPHFLYNVLTTISALCEKQNALEARDVTNRFADYFRMNLDSLGKDKIVPFEKELEHIETYLWLEKVRFADDLNINIETGPIDFMVPSLSIQPIVENAVKHGILKKDEPGTLTIKTSETKQDYLIIVEDDGVGFDVNEEINDGKSHVGLENVSKRLEIMCNGKCLVDSEKGRGTRVTITIPKGAL